MIKNFKIWWLASVYIFLSSGFLTTLYIFFVKRNVTFSQIFFSEFLGAFAVTILILLIKRWHIKKTMVVGFCLVWLALLSLLLPLPANQIIYLYVFLSYPGTILFFIPYNILYFKGGKQDANLQNTTFYWAVGIIAGILGPLFGTFVLHNFAFGWFIAVALLILSLVIFLTKYLPSETYTVDFSTLIRTIRGYRSINLLDGALHKAHLITITILSLKFISNELDFGKFLSLISLVALFFAFKAAKISDQKRKRLIFIWPLSVAAALITFSLYYVTNFLIFLILAIILKAVLVMVEPIRSNVLLDKTDKNNPLIWISREFFLNFGRSILWLLAFFLLYFNQSQLLFIFLAFLHLLYPLLIYYKKIYATPY